MPDPRFTARDLQEHSHWLYEVVISDQEATDLHRLLVKLSKVHGWSTRDICGTSCGIAIWLKSRLHEMGCFDVDHSPPEDLGRPVRMHVFFMHFEETESQLALLRGEEPLHPNSPARSRLNKYMETNSVSPIDKTAFKVAPPPYEASNG